MNATVSKTTTSASGRNLILNRVIDASPDKVFRAWTDPELITKWFAPLPYTTPRAEIDLRVGGKNSVTMKSPDGVEMPCEGVFLEIDTNKKLVWTDAYTSGWEPADKPFMTVILTFEDLGGKTNYTATVRHWTLEDREAHEKMGFHEGWAVCAEQLASLVETL